ncbi:FkbM family methyltransferase [Mucilaginibacter sp.]
MFKNKIKLFLQKVLGFNNFLFLFSIYTIKRLYSNKHEAEFLYFLSILPTNKILLDIGANIGIMTVPLAQKTINGKVYSFEPMPQNLIALKRVIKYYNLKNVTLFEAALGNEPGELKMVMPIINNVKMQGLCHVANENNPEEGEYFTLPVKRLDDIAELQNAESIGGIKIDVENFEFEVLSGAKQLLLKHKPPIYCELWDNEKRTITIDYLTKEIGYHVKIYDGEKLIPFTNQSAVNFFFIA